MNQSAIAKTGSLIKAMPFAVELYMDKAADAAVRRVWRSLVDQGIPSHPLAAGARPHVSLCLYESLDSSVFRKKLETFAQQISAFSS